jgi:hypothetical protein
MGNINLLLDGVTLPRMVKVRQKFDPAKIEDVPGAVRQELNRAAIAERV